MASLNMNGPYTFDLETINSEVTRTSTGNYALGYVNSKGTFIVQYVGRSDYNLKDRLKDHLKESFSSFKYSYAISPKAAFEKECNNYHSFTPLRNKIHPDRPENTNWKCPICDIFDK